MEGNEYLKWDTEYQNGDGDTAFHVAISKDADIDILKALLVKGVDVNVTNDNGKTPFECLKHGSWQTAINLLKLEKDFNLRDDIGDTFLHVLMDRVGYSVWGIRTTEDINEDFEESNRDLEESKRDLEESEQVVMIEKFWNNILENVEQFAINLNTQNLYGCTVLHKAINYPPSLKSLEVMLSHFEHVDPFIKNAKGDNFLHIYFLRNRQLSTQFQDKMIKGELRYLPKQTLVKLLNSQNNHKNTPLIIHLKAVYEKNVIDIEDILEAGADPNISDWVGDTALHYVFKKYSTTLQDNDFYDQSSVYLDKALQCFIKHGADVHATNHKGESPIFLANRHYMKILVNLGADINLQNSLRQTPFLYFVSQENVSLNKLETLLELGANVLHADIHGNTVLHYIAWHGNNGQFLPVLKKYKVQATKDNIGQLPCDVAYMQGHKAIFDKVCDCKKYTHSEQEHFTLIKEFININSLLEAPNEYQETFDRIRNFRGTHMSKVLSLPGMGAVNFEGESADINTIAKEIVENICAKLIEERKYLKCRIIQSGSVGENTKVDAPNEFDFVIIFEKFEQLCIVDEQESRQDQGYAYLTLNPEDPTEECDYVDELEYYEVYKKLFNEFDELNTSQVRTQVSEIINDLYTTPSLFQHPNISFERGRTKDVLSPTITFSFSWNGCLYKKLLIEVDLVPACQVKEWWPDNCNIDGLHGNTKLLKEQGAILLFQSELNHDVIIEKLRVSAMSAEKEHMLHLPQVARDAYKVCKILCNDRICPQLQFNADRLKRYVSIKRVVTSYMLKNALFHTMDDMEASQELKTEPTENKKPKLDQNVELSNIVRNIFLKLLMFTKEENLPSYVFPWQNVFTFNLKGRLYEDHDNGGLRHCFIKIILTMLGEKQDFSDIAVFEDEDEW